MQSRTMLFILIAAAGGLQLLSGCLPQSGSGRNDRLWLIYLLIIGLPLLAGLLLRIRRQPLTELRNAAIWVGIVVVLLIGYSYRDDLRNRIMGELLPARGIVEDDRSVSFRTGADGSFHVQAVVDGVALQFIVDTGASHVVLTPADARRLGYDPDRLEFSQVTETAGGTGRGAPITLREISVGGIVVTKVPGMVIETDMRESLLGMSFLSRLSGFEFSGDKLTLRR